MIAFANNTDSSSTPAIAILSLGNLLSDPANDLKSLLADILKKNIRKTEVKKNRKRAGYRYIGFPSSICDIRFTPNNTTRAQPDAQRILKKSKKVEYLIIPAYVLKRNINRILTIIITKKFPLKYSVKLIFTCRFFKNKYVVKTEKETIEISIKKINHLGIYLNSLILKTFTILQA
ncbi:hypothetical protein HNP36_001422 [Chryseobacterium shigense]|uniref:Uncharacterized protein n=1 Tax=Chryseobacterium shigense TaxID=297244 RepID=A0A841NGE0_9FLAO|nr:hypothetical protein [Chryseobacterium shigense]MBB6370369.1 hypothetical protein [Chryseobacterium shigense]